MPKGSKGERHPADAISNAVHVMRIATGEVDEGTSPLSPAAELGRKVGEA
jgi:hypothetical protein